MPYQEPLPSLALLRSASVTDSTVRVTDERGLPLDVSFYEDIGWCIETRYDVLNQAVKRQIFTGAQESLPLTAPELSENDTIFTMKAGDQTLTMRRDTGHIAIVKNNVKIFESMKNPFSRHEQPIEIEEGIISLKVTELSERTPFFPPAAKMKTSMLRFQYPRPQGLIMGLPGQTGEVNRNGYRFELFNTDETLHVPSRRPLYQSWPILFHKDPSGTGWLCVFHDNPSRTFVDLGDFYEAVTFESQAGNSRIYVLWAPTLHQVSAKISQLLGGSLFPPLWAFGYQQCRWSYMSVADLRKVVHAFRDHDIPLDCLYYDIDYMDGFRVFTNNAMSFGEMAEFLKETNDAGIKSVCIIDPGVKIDENYPIYKKVLESGRILKLGNGQPFQARVWAGLSVFPDFGDETMQELWSDLESDWLKRFPFDGFWNDMNEPANFDGQNKLTVTAHTGRGPITDEYNLYGYHMARASKKGILKARPKERPFVITRSGYAGVQKESIIWHGDNQSWWEHMRMALETAVNYSLCGAQYTGPDVPGFNGNPPDDLAVRFYQLGSLLPFFRGHSIYFSKDKEPYAFGEEAKAIIKDTIHMRYSLLREWYSNFEHCVHTHHPALQPVLDAEGRLVRDQFMLFDKFLAAPVIERDQTQKLIYLPEGQWYRFGDTNEIIEGNAWLTLTVKLDTLPLFVKAGSIVVRNATQRNTRDTLAAPESFDVYPDSDGNAEGIWFNDDGVSIHDSNAKFERLIWNASTSSIDRISESAL
jgi:alpha-glucosidase